MHIYIYPASTWKIANIVSRNQISQSLANPEDRNKREERNAVDQNRKKMSSKGNMNMNISKGTERGSGIARLIRRIMGILSTKTSELRTRLMVSLLLHRNRGLVILDKFRAALADGGSSSSSSSNTTDHINGHRHRRLHKIHHLVRTMGGWARHHVTGIRHHNELESDIDYDADEGNINMLLPSVLHHDEVAFTAAREAINDIGAIDLRKEQDHENTDLTNTLFKESEKDMELSSDLTNDTRRLTIMMKSPQEQEKLLVNGDHNNKQEDDEDIDEAANLFIQRFRNQIQLQKQLSFLERHPHLANQIL